MRRMTAVRGRWGQSSWLNYWQGRDEDLWTSEPGTRT